MKLYIISNNESGGYDTFDSAVVCAENEEEARKIHPGEWVKDKWWEKPVKDCDSSWATRLENINVEYIGEADEGIEPGVILASFNAGQQSGSEALIK